MQNEEESHSLGYKILTATMIVGYCWALVHIIRIRMTL